MEQLNYVQSLPVPVQLILGVLVLLVLLFIGLFLFPAFREWIRLSKALRQLRALRDASGGDSVSPKKIADEAMLGRSLRHLWDEFTDTLHEQRVLDSAGQVKSVRWRSTVPAETFFSAQTLVDTPLRTEFFKHLPGIFTGVGIIGTFFGLIQGLRDFKVVEDPNVVRDHLKVLVDGVYVAFFVSASAIGLAMIATFLEKLLVTARYKQVEELCQLIDSLFDAGAGEEYLARLVNASESSATQTQHLKEALVGDLKQILSELTKQQIDAISANSQAQIAANTQSTKDLAAELTKSIGGSLKEPLDQIAAAVNRTTDNQGDAVNKILTDVLASFTAKMQDMLGGQMTGMNQLLQQTINSLQTTVAKFDKLAANIDSAGRGAADAMAERLNQAMASLEARQQTMNSQMGEFVEQIRSLVRESQSETSQKLQTILTELGEKMSAIVADLRAQAQQASATHQTQQHQMAEHTTGVVSGLSGQVETLVQKVAEATQTMQASVAAMRDVTTDAMNRMNSGADTLFMAADEFAKAGQGVAGVMQQVNTASDKLTTASGALTSAITGIQGVVADYQTTRDTFALMVENLKTTVENAKREAGVTQELVTTLKAAAGELVAAQNEAEKYLHGVTEVLTHTYRDFAENIGKTLREANTQFHRELADATNYLKTAVQDLADVVDDIPKR